MQTMSYRWLKWTLLACASAALAPACVVTTGDGDDNIFDGGEGGTGNGSAGKSTGGGGKSSSAGTTATGGGGSSSTAGTSSGGGGAASGGTGGTEPTYEAGLCDFDAEPDELEGPTPTEPADVTPKDTDGDCLKCLKAECADEWSTCYGEAPRIACGWGPTEDDIDGQFDCILGCFFDGAEDPTGTADELLLDCTDQCTNQCGDVDGGNVMVHTSDLIACANDAAKCQAECFPF